MTHGVDGQSPAAATSAAGPDTLRGDLGVPSLVFTALAYNAPLAITAGFVPLIVGVGNGLGAPLLFPMIGGIILLFAVGLNAMAERMKRPGAFYSYISTGIGKPMGLGAGFLALASYIVIGAGAYALFAVSADHLVVSAAHGPSLPWWVWAAVAWIIGTTLSLFNIDISARVLGLAMVAEIAIVAVWDVVVLADGGPEGRGFNPIPSFVSGSLTIAIVFGVTCFVGFEALQVFREETRDPVRTVSRATYVTVILLLVLYGASAWTYIVAFGPSQAIEAGAADPTGSFLGSISAYLSVVVGDAANVLLMTSSFAAALASQNIAARYAYSLGKDRVLPVGLGRVHPRHGSPMPAAASTGAVTALVLVVAALSGLGGTVAYSFLVGIGIYVMIGLWVVTSLAVIVFFRRQRSEHVTAWQAVGAPTLAFVGLGSIFLVATTHISDLIGGGTTTRNLTLAVVAAIGAGGVCFALWLKRRKPDVYGLVGSQR
ncbi:APC family permease [Rhodococcus koreensis]